MWIVTATSVPLLFGTRLQERGWRQNCASLQLLEDLLEHTYEKDSERNIFPHFCGTKLQLCGFLSFLGGLKAKNNTLNLSLLKLSLKSLVTEDSCITGEPNKSLYSTCPSTTSFSVGMV